MMIAPACQPVVRRVRDRFDDGARSVLRRTIDIGNNNATTAAQHNYVAANPFALWGRSIVLLVCMRSFRRPNRPRQFWTEPESAAAAEGPAARPFLCLFRVSAGRNGVDCSDPNFDWTHQSGAGVDSERRINLKQMLNDTRTH